MIRRPRSRRRADDGRGHVLAVDGKSARLHRRDSRQGIRQLLLAVAADAGDAQDFAAAHGQGDFFDTGGAVAAANGKSVDDQPCSAGCRRRQRPCGFDVLADHESRKPAGVQCGCWAVGGDSAPLAHHRHPVAVADHFPQLVGDQDNAAARGEQCCARQPAATPLPDRSARRSARPARRCARPAPAPCRSPPAGARRSRAGRQRASGSTVRPSSRAVESSAAAAAFGVASAPLLPAVSRTILGHAETVHEAEMLMHHADAGGDGVAGPANRQEPAVEPDLAPVRRIDAGQRHSSTSICRRRSRRAVRALRRPRCPGRRRSSDEPSVEDSWRCPRATGGPGAGIGPPAGCRQGVCHCAAGMVPMAPWTKKSMSRAPRRRSSRRRRRLRAVLLQHRAGEGVELAGGHLRLAPRRSSPWHVGRHGVAAGGDVDDALGDAREGAVLGAAPSCPR